MNSVLVVFLTLSLSGSLLALILLAIKSLIKNKLSQTWQYYIWLVVILRLLLPLTPQVSVIGEMTRYFQNATATPAIVEVNPGIIENQDNAISVIPQVPNIPQTAPSPQEAAVETIAQPDYWKDILNNIWMLWLGIALVLFAHKVTSYRSFVQFVKVEAKRITDTHILNIYEAELTAAKVKRQLPLYVNDQVISPMLIGILRPSIIIPVLKSSDDELRHIFRHELIHQKRLDFLYKWIVQIVMCLHWFNPLVYLINKEINRLCELSCDETVIKHLDVDSRVIYGDALVATLKAPGNYNNFVLSITMSGNANLVKERLDMMMNYKKKSGLMICITILLTTLLLCGFTFTGAYAAVNSNKNAQGNVPISTPNTVQEVYGTTNGNKNAQSNIPISTANTEKQVTNLPDNYKQIVKSLDGVNIQNININADFCTVKLETTSSNTFEAVFSYPTVSSPNYENHFNLRIEKADNNMINISTDYDKVHGFDPIAGYDLYDLQGYATLLIKVPQKQYSKVKMSFSGINDQTINFDINTPTLEIISGGANITFVTDKIFDNLYIDHNAGNFDLQLKEISKNMNFDIETGDFILSLPNDPPNLSLTVNNIDGSVCELPATWKTSLTGNTVLYERGNKQYKITVNNKNNKWLGTFALNINGIPHKDTDKVSTNNIPNTPSQVKSANVKNTSERYLAFNQTDAAKRLSNDITQSGNYFSWDFIDVVDNDGYASPGLVFVCKGLDSYKQIFNQALEQLYTAYPKSEDIVGYLDSIPDKSLRNYGSKDFSTIKKVVVTDANGVQYDAYIVVVCGSDNFMKSYNEFNNTVMKNYDK